MSLTDEQRILRQGKLTASAIGYLVRNDEEVILNLYYELTNDQRFVPLNLTDNFSVQMGICTEPLNLIWYTKKTGHQVLRQGEVCFCSSLPYAACTLDGWDGEEAMPIEAKHVNGFKSLNDTVDYYMPQLQWQMLCTGAVKACLSVIAGTNEPSRTIIGRDENYINKLIVLAEAFMGHVADRTPPVDLPVVESIPTGIPTRVVDFTGNNQWGAWAGTYRDTEEMAKAFEACKKGMKDMVERDVAKAHGHGIEINRGKDGSLRFKKVV